ncbi:MAG TPA: hypothetical protein V6D17_21455 [Candidatus Obscuribacterales bacterium]
MKGFRLTKVLAPAVAAMFVVGLPAMANYPFADLKPVGMVHQREIALNKEIQAAYKRGLIDSFEVAQMQRDLDGVRTEDDYFRIDSTNGRRAAAVLKKLDQLEADLFAHEADNDLAATFAMR